MELENAAGHVNDLVIALRSTARQLDALPVPMLACGADASGALGALGRAWVAQMSGAVAARTGEAVALADAAADLTYATGQAMSGYRSAEARHGGV